MRSRPNRAHRRWCGNRSPPCRRDRASRRAPDRRCAASATQPPYEELCPVEPKPPRATLEPLLRIPLALELVAARIADGDVGASPAELDDDERLQNEPEREP